MRKEFVTVLLAAALSASGCQQPANPPAASGSPAPAATANAQPTTQASASATPEAAKGGLPFEFTAGQPTAEAGGWAFTPMASSVEDLVAGKAEKASDFRPREMVKPGPEMSTIKDGKEFEVPNSLIISADPDAKAAVGDIVLGNPQYSSMEVAIVTDAADPASPTVHFFKPVYSGSQPEGDKFVGQLEAGKFRPIKNDLDPGSRVLYPDGDAQGYGQVIKAEGDRVLVTMFGGDLAAFDVSEVTPVPVKPALKVGDKVRAPFAKGMDPATISKVDEKIGRVWVKFEGRESSESVFCYGQILPAQ